MQTELSTAITRPTARQAVGQVRVMHLVHGLRPGGMEFGVLKIVNALAGSGVSSSICSTVASEGMKHLVDPSVPVYEFDRREGNDPRVVWWLYHLLRRERPNILHTHAWGTLYEGLIAGRLAGVPAIVHGEHGTLQLSPRQVTAQRWGWNRADHVLSVSSRLAERMAEAVGVPLDRVHVIRNGVNLARFSGRRSAEARRALGASAATTVVIGAAGRLVDVKDHATFVEAIAALKARRHDVVGVIAGDGPLKADLEARITRAGLDGSVRLLGHRGDIEQVFEGLDIFVQSSKSEGMSNTILEAMASGLPVVATHVGGADEMVVPGETGILVPPSNAERMADALARLVEGAELRTRMGQAGRRRAFGEFSLDRMIHNYETFYRDVAGRRAGQPS